MRIAYFDCFSGASGDMILGSMIDAGLNLGELREEIKKIPIPQVELRVKKVLRGGISATQLILSGKKEERSHRTLDEILRILEKSRLEPELKRESQEVFERIARVESEIHRQPAKKIHFHELGGRDSIVDIVGSLWGMKRLEIERLYVSKVNVGSGFVRCEHGLLPVPAPATLSLMKGKPIYSSGVERELLTPTGAALLSHLGSNFGTMPEMRVERVGYGAGKDELLHPNVLRLLIGSPTMNGDVERVTLIEASIDDMNPQFYEYVMEKLFNMGVYEVYLTPIFMKKSRPGTLLTIICQRKILPSVTELLLKETTTIGLRWHEEERSRAERETVLLRTKYGRIRFKLARWQGRVTNLSPEYEDCKDLAAKKKVALKEVFEEARKEATAFLGRQRSLL